MKKEKAIQIIEILKKSYPDAKCSLDFTNPFELVVAVMLSAQCTDERVNLTTPTLFQKYPSPQDFANCSLEDLEQIVHPCGFYKNKAKNIKACATKLIQDFNGIVPPTMEDLLTLPGVGRKSANVILLEVFGIANGVAVDTHAKRISNRTGFSKEKEPEKIEQDLIHLFPASYLKDINHTLIWHGRAICTSRNPKCQKCPIATYCENKVNPS